MFRKVDEPRDLRQRVQVGGPHVAFFGILGAGSIYYLSYGLNHLEVAAAERLWGLVALVILSSILLHGLTVTPVMRRLDRQQGRDPDAGAETVEGVRDGPPDHSEPGNAAGAGALSRTGTVSEE